MQLTEKQQRVIEYLQAHQSAELPDVARVIRGTTYDARNVMDQLNRKHLIKKRYREEKRVTFGGTKVGKTKLVVYSLIN
jgi:predicted ArsR family transcriptional regulator